MHLDGLDLINKTMCNVKYQGNKRCYRSHQKIQAIINGRYRAFKTWQTFALCEGDPPIFVRTDIGYYIVMRTKFYSQGLG